VEADLQLREGLIHVAYKQYRPRNWWKSLCSLCRRSRARRNWHLARALMARGIATARPVAICETRRSRFFRPSYLATEWIESGENLHLYGWRLAGRPLRQRLRDAAGCAESLGRLVGQMHAERISHRDLKGANLLVVQPAGPQGHGRTATYLIDLDGLRFRRRLSPARRAADMARLAVGLEAHPWVTRSLCCRFLRAYIAQLPPGRVAFKTLWRAVAARSRRMARRMRRRGEEVL
jgi:tRNA A-37 threonylcarbamoyl transferase component Bud32